MPVTVTRNVLPLLAFALLLAGCGGGESAGDRRVVDVAAAPAVGTPAERHWQWFVTNVRSWSPGYAVALVPRPERGVEALGEGELQVLHAELDEAARLLPELAVLGLPFLFVSDAEADFVLDRHVFPEVERRLHEHGLQLLAFTEGEPRLFDLAQGPEAARIDLVPLEAQLVADAARRPIAPRKALLLDGGHAPGLVLARSAWFDRLPPRDRDAFRRAYATADARDDTRREAERALAQLEQDPERRIRRFSAEEMPEWRRIRTPRLEARVAELGPAAQSLWTVVERGRAEFAARAPAAAGGGAGGGPGSSAVGGTGDATR